MSIRLQSLILAVIIIGSIAITYAYDKATAEVENTPAQEETTVVSTESGSVSSRPKPQETKKLPVRKWEVIDPSVDAEAVMIQSLDTNFPFFNYQTYKQWPMASVSKLITAIVVAEDFGMNKRIPITEEALTTEGIAGELKSGEVYVSEDLLKILLLVSSNDAATAFEEYAGGREAFIALATKKIAAIGMTQTVMKDASGLSPENVSTASDLIKLARYLTDKHPQIVSWTRLEQYLVQPVNDSVSRTVYNIDSFVREARFLGGKTGTSPEARENLLAFFTFGNERLAFIILGSHDRYNQTNNLLRWIREAYIFNSND
jgi:D-alanyl-D-alanine carboxypeptidase